jgi:hypothetical protein
MRKRFDKQLYAENDEKARKAAKEVLKGYTVIDNPRKMGVDLIVLDPKNHEKVLFYVECECKRVWKDKFSYDTVQFPERKLKYTQLDKKTYFIMFNHDFSEYLVVKGDDLASSPLEIVPNKYITYGEKFFKVPLSKVTFNKFKE